MGEVSRDQVDRNLIEMIATFERDHEDLVEALRIFGISNAEYEQALRALTSAPIQTGTSTHSSAQ